MNLKLAILATLAYSDIFDYPLTFPEIHQNLILIKSSNYKLAQALEKLVAEGRVLEVGEFYQLKKKENLKNLRLRREKYAAKKIKKVKFATRILAIIPTVKLVGVSGALAVSNTPYNDDIDLFVIAAKNFLWTTRFFCNLLLDFFGLRRKAGCKKVSDKICLNMFITEDSLKLTPTDLYLAHEILQLKPSFVRGNTYQKFLLANSWVYKFLPNWRFDAQRLKTNARSKRSKSFVVGRLSLVVENLLKNFQLKLMERRRTTEIISDTKLFFHPNNVHQKVLTEFKKRLKNLKIPIATTILFFGYVE